MTDETETETEDFGVKPNTWNALVRRARVGIKHKAAALIVGSYASPNGRDVKCGVARLATDCEVSYSTARRYLAWLREVGLIELVRAGNHRAKRADEYRLIIGAATREHLDIPEADEYRKLVEGVNESNFETEKKRRLRSSKVSADATESDDPSALIQGERRKASSALISGGHLRSSLCEPLPTTSITDHERAPTTGGTLPPDPLRRPPPPASANASHRPLNGPLTPAQDQQGESLPHASAPVALVYDFFTREVS